MNSPEQTLGASGNIRPDDDALGKARNALHSLPPSTQDTLKQIVATVIENEDEAKRESLIVNLIQLVISINQGDQSDSLYPSPELLGGYQQVDPTIVERLLRLTEETIKHDMGLESRQAEAEIALKQQQAEADNQHRQKQLDAQIELSRQEQQINGQLDHKQLESDIKSRNRGQWMAFGVAVFSFGVAGYAFSQGNDVAGAIIGVFGAAATAIGAFLRFRPVRQTNGKPDGTGK